MRRFIPDVLRTSVAPLRTAAHRAGAAVRRAGARLGETTAGRTAASAAERTRAEAREMIESARGAVADIAALRTDADRRAALRGRAAPLVIAVLLMAPMGGLLVSRAQLVNEATNVSDAADVTVAEATVPQTAALAGGEAVGDAWRTKALEREADAAAERFAKRYGISVPLARDIHDIAIEETIEPEIAFGLVKTESSFRRTAVSYAGAVGYTQLLPSTARWMVPGTSRSDLFETRTNLRIGFRYLRYLLDKYDDDTRLALLAYNRGPGTVDRLLRRGVNPDNGYARKVMRG